MSESNRIRTLSEETKRKRLASYKAHMYERAENEIGSRYGRFTIESINYEETEKHYDSGERRGVYFNCVCECGEKRIHRFNSLKSGHVKSCGCIKFNNPLNYEDLSGMEFGRLKVIRRDIDRDSKMKRKGNVHWVCQCNCGNKKLISATGYQLKKGRVKSCGCYASEVLSERNKKYSSKTNPIREDADKVILFDNSGNECIIDKEDYEIVKRWYWRKSIKRNSIDKGYWVTNVKKDDKYKKSVMMIHQIIAEIKYGELTDENLIPDHLSRNTDDNRKCNIVLKSNMDNCKNRGLSKSNSSGKTGVSFDKETKKWIAFITVNYKTMYLGSYHNIEDAIKARKDAEKRFGFTCDDVVASYDTQKG